MEGAEQPTEIMNSLPQFRAEQSKLEGPQGDLRGCRKIAFDNDYQLMSGTYVFWLFGVFAPVEEEARASLQQMRQ